jgi:hypothetical protein
MQLEFLQVGFMDDRFCHHWVEIVECDHVVKNKKLGKRTALSLGVGTPCGILVLFRFPVVAIFFGP